MRKHSPTICFSAWLFLMALGVLSCDTEKTLENPDVNYFVKYYGSDNDQEGVDMAALSDGSFLLLGNSKKGTNSDVYLVRVDAEGKVVWEKTVDDGVGITSARDLEPTKDGNFIVLSDYQQDIASEKRVMLLKISADGSVIDTDTVGSGVNDESRTVTVLSDGGFMVSGTTQLTEQWTPTDPGLDPGDTFNYRFSQSLDSLSSTNDWFPVYQGFGATNGQQLDVAVRAMEVIPDSLFYVFGYSSSNVNGNNPNARLGLFYFERYSSGSIGKIFYPGNILNVNDTEIQFVGPGSSQLGGGFIVVGTSTNNAGLSEIFLARLRSTLTFSALTNDATLYQTIPLGRNVQGVAAVSSVAGVPGYLVVGNEIRSTGATGKSNIWLTKIDQSGSVLWSSTFGSENEDDTGAAVVELADGRIVVLGTMGLADNQSKMALIKVNLNGQLLK